MGAELLKAEGYTTIDVENRIDLHCAFYFDKRTEEITLKFQDNEHSHRLVQLVAEGKLIGFALTYRTPDHDDRYIIKKEKR